MKRSIWYLYVAQIILLIPVVLYWLDARNWSLSGLSAVSLFPLLGLIAFSMMWLHLMVAALKKLRPEMFDYRVYYKKTGSIVLSLILLHPILLIYSSLDTGGTFLDYAGDSGKIFIAFGSLALLSFLVYEVADRLKERPTIKDNWQYIVAMNRVAFILVFVHGLQLGQHLQSGWLRSLWIFYGVTTAAYFVWVYKHEISRDSSL